MTATAVPPRKLSCISSWTLNFFIAASVIACATSLPKTKELRFHYVCVIHCESQGYPAADSFEVIARYEKLHDLLNNFFIGGVPFKDVIMNDNTEIFSKD